MDSFDLNQDLLAATISFYAELLTARGFPIEFLYSDIRHKTAYLFLQQKVADYLDHCGEISLFNRLCSAEE